MLLFDFNNVALSTIMYNHSRDNRSIELDMMRGLIIARLLRMRDSIGTKFNELPVLALDSRVGYWRRDVFPHYKASRKKGRDSSSFDYDKFFANLNIITEEFKHFMPFVVLQIDKIEADDIIAVLSRYVRSENHIILSEDKDLQQLCNANVIQYKPSTMAKMKTDYSLLEHIMSGDRGDGVPNIFSPNNALVEGIRQTAFTKKLKEQYLKYNLNDILDYLDAEYHTRYQENNILINLEMIPNKLIRLIINEYEIAKTNTSTTSLMDYLFEHKITRLVTDR